MQPLEDCADGSTRGSFRRKLYSCSCPIHAMMNDGRFHPDCATGDDRVDPSRENFVLVSSAEGHTNVVKLLLSQPRVDAATQIDEAERRPMEGGCQTNNAYCE
ncbi:hypothetical protein PROFUN_05822 [Planoprotostelium fungivorum]|uniref:Ankyrin repeat protein n=1 Tax=Planoprotostelium fungivorum TaxID=1890364 RepID=A0A2P6NQ17_9EUKA|nr:hypothetical protein PROFUN_05822 [Planoprotostelium fungivorum]